MSKNELAFENHEKAFEVAKILLQENYVVLLSLEESLVIINYEYATDSDRNCVIFMDRDDLEIQ